MDPKLEGLCPFLGFCDDRDTALSYPSKFNCCYKSKPVVPVSFYYQRTTCLSNGFYGCPVYKSDSIIPLPKEMAGRFPRTEKSRLWLTLMIVIFVGLIGVTLGAMLGIFNLPGIPVFYGQTSITTITTLDTMPQETNTVIPPTLTFTQALSPTVTDTPMVPTVVAPRSLETPFGTDPELVLHLVQEGEGFILLANTYNTSAEAIQAINYEMGNSLFANRVIVIPLNTTDVSMLPAFTLFEVTEENLLIETVAMGLNVDLAELCKYNHLPERHVLTRGEWLLIPR